MKKIIYIIIYRLLLEYSYIKYIQPWFDYAGFIIDFDFYKYAESWIIYLYLFILNSKNHYTPSKSLIYICFIVFVVPFISFYSLTNGNRYFFYLVLFQYVLIIIFHRLFSIFSVKFSLKTYRFGFSLIKLVSVCLVFITTFLMIYFGGLSNFNLDFSQIYEFRDTAFNKTFLTGVTAYTTSWTLLIFAPFLLINEYENGGYLNAFIIFFLYFIWFGMTSHKSFVFYPFFITFVYKISKSIQFNLYFLKYITYLLSLCIIIDFYLPFPELSNNIARRIFYVPSFLTFVYYEFFTNNAKVFWSNSFMSFFIDYPYNESVPFVIGNFLNDSTLYANNSFFSTSYMNAGIFGIILYSFIMSFILFVLDIISLRIDKNIVLSLSLLPFFQVFTSADLMTSLLTYGIGVLLVVLYLISERYQKNQYIIT